MSIWRHGRRRVGARSLKDQADVQQATADHVKVKYLAQSKRHRFVTLQHVKKLPRFVAACH
jgi:hypothetical protein